MPAAPPMIFTGLRLSLQASWTTLVAAELVGALAGLGRVLNVGQQDIYPAMIMVAMIAVAVLGWATTRVPHLEWRAMPWHPAARGRARGPMTVDSRSRAARSLVYGVIGLVWLLCLWTRSRSPDWCRASSCRPRSRSPAASPTADEALRRLDLAAPRVQLPALRAGFLLAAAIGIPLGLLMGWFRWLDDIVTPLFDALRFIAPIAWVPFAALWFGTGIGGPIMIIFSGAFPPCLINAYRGAKFVDRSSSRPRACSAPAICARSTEVLLPASVPSIVAGLRVSAGPRLAIAGRRRADRRLGGRRLHDGEGPEPVSTPTVMAGMIAIGLVGLIDRRRCCAREASIRRRRGLA